MKEKITKKGEEKNNDVALEDKDKDGKERRIIGMNNRRQKYNVIRLEESRIKSEKIISFEVIT